MKRTVFAAVLLPGRLTLFGMKKASSVRVCCLGPRRKYLNKSRPLICRDLWASACYFTIDYDDGYLLSAHLGAGLLYVIDLKNHKVLMTIPDVPGVEGVEYVPELKRLHLRLA